ncbi:hypothetical protein B0H19DRAFT_1377719 [Mycena capillaripes]|nr:hypothetical protein B0H19DRAFT_1377719 [Mycena capillaripes]
MGRGLWKYATRFITLIRRPSTSADPSFQKSISIKMTEYDYSPEAIQQYLQSQTRIQQWSAATARSHPCDPNTPPTPAAPKSIALPPIHGSGTSKYATEPLASVGVETQPGWAHKKQDVMRKMQASGGPAPGSLTVQTPATGPAPNQTYAYTQQTTPYGSQLSITTQTSDGRYVQQQSYRQMTRPVHPSSGTLAVPPVNYAPLARNPYPTPEQFNSLPRAAAPITRDTRVRSKSSHSERRAFPGGQADGGMYVPPVPPMPERHRAHSSVRPPGAAAPLHPANGAYANGMYGAPPSAVSSFQLPGPYVPAPARQRQQQYPTPALAKTKSKSSATLNTRYATEARRPRLEEAPPMPAPQQVQPEFYATPRASKSSATLYAEPRASPKSTSKSSKSKRAHKHRPPMPEFGEKMSSPHPAASQMLVHSLVPLATYREPEPARAKPPSLFKRMFLGKRSN